MITGKDTFLKYFQFHREDDAWDYKESLKLRTKPEKFEFLRDALAFANYGGGHILVGIKNDFNTIVDVQDEHDDAKLGDIIDSILCADIRCTSEYFDVDWNSSTRHVGIVKIHPSREILVAGSDLHDSRGKNVVTVGDIFTRRNTRTVRALTTDIRQIVERLYGHVTVRAAYEHEDSELQILSELPYSILNDTLKDAYEPNAKNFGRKLEQLWRFSAKFSKQEFAALIGLAPADIDQYFEGKLPIDFNVLIRATKLLQLPTEFFFKPTYNLRFAFWKEDLIRYAVLRLCSPKEMIGQLTPESYYLIFYQLADNIAYFHDLLFDRESFSPFGNFESPSVLDFKINSEFIEHNSRALSVQYYKVLEQYRPNAIDKGLSKPEQIIHGWFECSDSHINRIVAESIIKIDIRKPQRPRVTFSFWEDVRREKVTYRTYDAKQLRMKSRSK